jgi:hypothetical protein
MSKYPADIDTNEELPPVVDGVSETGGETINAIIKAIFAIEQALGADPQGAATNLTTRLATALNDDGTIKAAALASAGLVSLPIDNDDVGSSAAIVESKLNLEVGTQSLQNQVSLNDIDISELQDSLAALILRLSRHVNGLAERHDGYQIDVLGGLPGASYIATVGEAIDFLRQSFLNHVAETDVGEHFASAITYIPQVDGIITANNVQDAIGQFDDDLTEDRRLHNDHFHSNGVSNDGYVLFDGQAFVNDAIAKLTRYQPNTGSDIMQIGLVSAPSVKTKGFDPNAFSASAGSIDIEVVTGTNTRTLSVTGLDTSEYPTSAGRVTQLSVVDAFNAAFANVSASAHFPVSAYASEDGEIVLQHNMSIASASITLRAPSSLSAVDALGFTDIIGNTVGKFENYSVLVDGKKHTELATIADGYTIQASLSTTVDLGEDITTPGVRANMLLQVYNHTTAASDGTYKITGLGGSDIVTLAENMVAGSFDWIIYDDTCNTNSITTNRHVLDFYLDGYLAPIMSDRATIVFGGVEGIHIVEVSQDFPALTGTFTLATSGSQKAMTITDADGYTGIETLFDAGFIGYLPVYAPDNVSYVTAFVFDIVPVNGTDTLTVIATEGQDDRMLLGTTYHNGLSVMEIPLDKRNIGLTGNSTVGSEFKRDALEEDLRSFHVSGVVRGFDITDTFGTSLRLRGGTAYIGGRKIDKPTQVIPITNVATSDSTWNLMLTKEGNYQIYEEGSGASTTYSVADAVLSDDLIILAQFVIASGVISSTLDARFMVNDIESRLQLTVDNRDLGAGSFRTLEAANLYSKSAPNDTKPEITILSDFTFATDQTIDSGARIISFGDLTFDGQLIMSSNSELIVYGALTVTGATTLNSGATLDCRGTSSFATTITASDDVSLKFGGNSTMTVLDINGSRVKVVGVSDEPSRPTLTFDGSADGIDITGAYTELLVTDLDFIMSLSTNAIISLSGVRKVNVKRCSFSQSTVLTTGQIAQIARAGIKASGSVDELDVEDGYFYNIGAGIYGVAAQAITICRITNNLFSDVGSAADLDTVADLIATNNVGKGLHNNAFKLTSAGTLVINDNLFRDNYDALSTPTVIDIASAQTIVLDGNIFLDFDGVSVISAGTTLDPAIISNNIFEGNTTTSAALSITQGTVSDNIIKGQIGAAVTTTVSPTLFTGNFVEVTDTGTSFSMAGGVLTNNFMTGLDIISLDDVVMSGNDISAGSMTFTTSSVTGILSGNDLNFTETGVSESLNIVGTSTADFAISGNRIVGVATSGPSSCAVRLDGGDGTFVSNIVSASASTNRAIMSGDGYSSNPKVISNNLVDSGSTYGIYIAGDNHVVEGNIVSGTVGAGGGDLVVGTGITDVLVSGNHANGSGGSERVFQVGGQAGGVVFYMNKNGLERRAFSVYTSTQESSWSVALGGFSSTTVGRRLMIPLNGLPIGVALSSVDVHISNAGALGDSTVAIYERSASSLSQLLISTVTNVPNGFSTLNVPLTSINIEVSKSYFVLVDINVGTLQTVGQVVANIRI